MRCAFARHLEKTGNHSCATCPPPLREMLAAVATATCAPCCSRQPCRVVGLQIESLGTRISPFFYRCRYLCKVRAGSTGGCRT
jgi:hypothetical protein